MGRFIGNAYLCHKIIGIINVAEYFENKIDSNAIGRRAAR